MKLLRVRPDEKKDIYIDLAIAEGVSLYKDKEDNKIKYVKSSDPRSLEVINPNFSEKKEGQEPIYIKRRRENELAIKNYYSEEVKLKINNKEMVIPRNKSKLIKIKGDEEELGKLTIDGTQFNLKQKR